MYKWIKWFFITLLEWASNQIYKICLIVTSARLPGGCEGISTFSLSVYAFKVSTFLQSSVVIWWKKTILYKWIKWFFITLLEWASNQIYKICLIVTSARLPGGCEGISTFSLSGFKARYICTKTKYYNSHKIRRQDECNTLWNYNHYSSVLSTNLFSSLFFYRY